MGGRRRQARNNWNLFSLSARSSGDQKSKSRFRQSPLKALEKSLCLFPAAGGCQQSLACSYITPIYVSIVIWAFSLCLPNSWNLRISPHLLWRTQFNPQQGVREDFSEETILSGHLSMRREGWGHGFLVNAAFAAIPLFMPGPITAPLLSPSHPSGALTF